MAAPKKVDYDLIEAGWRAGIQSPAQLAAEYTAVTGVSVSHAAIIKHFRKLDVPRDLAAKVRAKADAMVMESLVTGKVSSLTTKPDAEVIAGSAIAVSTVRITHRNDIGRAKRLVMSLLGELEAQSDQQQLFQELGEFLRSDAPGAQDRRQEVYSKVISTAGRIDGARKLVEALRTMISLERQAYGILDGYEAPPSDADSSGITTNETARRIAFALAKGLQGK